MSAERTDLYCEQGATFSRLITLPFSITGYTLRGQIRTEAHKTLVETFTCTAASVSSFTIALTAAETAVIPTTGRRFSDVTRYVYDVEVLAPGGAVTRVIYGYFIVSPGITRTAEP